jgi:hypothetical protein
MADRASQRAENRHQPEGFSTPVPLPVFAAGSSNQLSKEIARTNVHFTRHRPAHHEPDHNPTHHQSRRSNFSQRRPETPHHHGRRLVAPVAATAGDKIEGLRQWASGRCLSADRAGLYSLAQTP